MDFLLDFILHIDQYMVMIVRDYHAWTYAILFSIIFCETGLVVTPFLPGDSLLFVAGAISALPDMPISVHILVIILFAAAELILGQQTSRQARDRAADPGDVFQVFGITDLDRVAAD